MVANIIKHVYNERMNTAYTYNDVLIKPKYSEVLSRSNVDLTTKIGNATLSLPVITSNMKTITGPKMAKTVAEHGGLGVLHRFNTIQQAVQEYLEARGSNGTQVAVSIGVKEEDKQRFEQLYNAGVRIFCIDVAHGHHIHVKNMLKWINNEIFLWDRNNRGQITVIAGNIATPDAYIDLTNWGADAVKVGIGPSPVCRTRFNTGAGVPQLYALQSIYEQSCKMQAPTSIIADGGISHVGDIAKALKYADAVMLGSMISGTSETPGQVFRNEDGEFYKVYGGSASGENKGENRFVEGVIKTTKFKGKVKYIFKEIREGVQSAFSYVGANNLLEYQHLCEFVHLSVGSQRESKV